MMDSTRGATVIDMTAMIDVIFILLIFWMTVTRLVQSPDGPAIDTPLADGRIAAQPPPQLMTVSLLDDRVVMVDGRRMPIDSLGDVLAAGPLPKHVLLRAASDTDCRTVTRLADLLRRAGVPKVGLAVRSDQP
ncbi:MAG: ExbD/TolR family protein [Phycisphaerae bacterium]